MFDWLVMAGISCVATRFRADPADVTPAGMGTTAAARRMAWSLIQVRRTEVSPSERELDSRGVVVGLFCDERRTRPRRFSWLRTELN